MGESHASNSSKPDDSTAQRFLREWCDRPTGPLPDVVEQEAIDRVSGAIALLSHAAAGECPMRLALEASCDLLREADELLDVAPPADSAA